MKTHAEVSKELIKGIVDIARHKEFYGHIIQQLEKVFVSKPNPIDTAAVGREPGDRFIKLYMSTDFFAELFEQHGNDLGWKYMLSVLEHEVLHIVFGHLFVTFQDKVRGNVAKDLVVNGFLQEDCLPGNYVHPSQYGFETDKSAVWYYTHLKDNEKFKQQCASGQFGTGGILSHIMSSHGMGEDAADDVVAKEFVKDIVRKSKDLCGKNYGNIPGGIIEQIEALLEKRRAIVPWGKVLRMFVSSCAESILDYTIKRISRRYGTRPGTRTGDVLNIAIGVDTSGSVDDNLLALFFNEIRWVWKNGAKITVFECDCRVGNVYPYKGKNPKTVSGRGGTELEPVLKEVEGKFDALIYFTDFYAPPVSRVYRIPTLWVLKTELRKEEFPVKWGRRIVIENDKAVAA